jgi:hypothetical protein
LGFLADFCLIHLPLFSLLCIIYIIYILYNIYILKNIIYI